MTEFDSTKDPIKPSINELKLDSTEDESITLAEILKSTHKALRTEMEKCKDDRDVHSMWVKHTMKKDLLQKYSEAMHNLATEHWNKRSNVSRIHWIYDALKEYYFGELLTKKLEKERRRILKLKPDTLETFENAAKGIKERTKKLVCLRVLDVGSCYNPFGNFEDLDVIPIDLHPAKPDVYSCDFINVKLKGTKEDLSESRSSTLLPRKHKREGRGSFNQEHKRKKTGSEFVEESFEDERCYDKFENIFGEPYCDRNKNYECSELCEDEVSSNCKGSQSEGFKERETSDLKYDINELPRESFDAVIFSFFLEYIPTAKLRYECCCKAYELLRFNGLLSIVTPDSKHVTGNSHVFKMWKITLTFLGFERVKYDKCAHFHGMVFRKALDPSALTDDAERELKVMQSRTFFGIYTKLNWFSVRSSLYLVQEMQAMKQKEKKLS